MELKFFKGHYRETKAYASSFKYVLKRYLVIPGGGV